MAGVRCPACDAENLAGEVLCVACHNDLADAGGRRRGHEPPPDAVAAAEATALLTCPVCGAHVPDPANPECVVCLTELPRTRHEPAAAALRLCFGDRTVGVPDAGSVLLGRDEAASPFAALFADRDNVSRRHASVGVDPDGTAWVRDEYSSNGTYVNDRPVVAGAVTPLAEGDVLRMASDVEARIELGRRSTS